MTGYSVKIKEASKDLSAKARVMIKDTSDARKIDEATAESAIIINPDFYAVLEVHNEKSDNTDYEVFVIVDKDGQKYVTGSPSFISSFMNILDEMADCDDEWAIKVYRMDSKNYKGKQFITCSVI